MDQFITTKHSLIRAKERLNLNSKSAKKLISQAINRGIALDNYTTCMEKTFLKHSLANNCHTKVYNGFCYIFNENDICVTMYKLPSWFNKKKQFDGKIRIRSIKKYLKLNQNLTF